MRRLVHRSLLRAGSITVAGTAILPSPQATAPTWRIAYTSPHHSGLGSRDWIAKIAAVNDHDAWAVGGSTPKPGSNQATALHWNGHRWTRTPLPAPFGSPSAGPDTKQLTLVAASSSTNAWAFGEVFSNNGNTRTLYALRWNGR